MFRQKSNIYLSEPTRKSKRINKSIFHRRNGISSCNKILNSNAKHSTNESSDCITINNRCRDCGKNFRSAVHLKNHFCNKVSDKPLECKICRKTFRQQNNLKMHYRVHLRDVSLGKNSRNNLAKESHFNTHLVDSPKKLSTSKLSLNTIKPSNYPKKQFSINRKYRTVLRSACGIIKEKNHLVQHSDALVDDQSFSCSKCKMLFRRKDHLQRHSRIHTGDKPFSCNVCNKFFSRPDHLKRHFLTHLSDNPFSCCKCMKVFKHKNYLTLHNKIHLKSTLFDAKNIKRKSEKVFKRKTGIRKNLDDLRQEKPVASKARSKMLKRTNRIRTTSGAHIRDKSLSNEKCDKNSNYKHGVISLDRSYSVSSSIESCISEKIKEEKHPEEKVCVDLAENPFNGIEKAVSPSDNVVIDSAISENENSQDCCDGNKEYSNDIELNSKTAIEHPMYSHGGNKNEVISSACNFSVRDSTDCCISEKIEDKNHLERTVCVDITDNPSNGIENLKAVLPGDKLVIDANISKNENSEDCCDGNKGYSSDIELKNNNVIEYLMHSHGGTVHEMVSSACSFSVRDSTKCYISEKIIEDRNHLKEQVCVDITNNPFNGIENLKVVSPGNNLVIDSNISAKENYKDCCDGNKGYSNDIDLKSNNVIKNPIYSYCGDIHEVVSSICTHSVRDLTECCFPEKAIEYNEYPEWQVCFDLIEKTFNGIENLKAMLQDDNLVTDSNGFNNENSQHCCDDTTGHPTDIQLKSKNVVEYTIICSYCGEWFKRHGDLQRHLRAHRLTLTTRNESSRIK